MTSPPTDPTMKLVQLAAAMGQAFAGGMQSQLQWLEDAALALDDVDGGQDAAHDLKAALGAILTFARGPQDKPDELEALVRTLLTRGVAGLYRALSTSLRELADVRTAQRSLCLDLAGVMTQLARATERGEPAPKDALERLAAAQEALS